MDERVFYNLIGEFRNEFLSQEKYSERIALHRRPIHLKNEILRKLYDYNQVMQNRPEMRCMDLDDRGLTHVPTVIIELRNRDKRLRSLFDAVKAYCSWSGSNLLTIAVHIAEYRAIYRLINRFQRETILPSKKLKVPLYTLEDWLQSKFFREKTFSDEYVANDSEKYLDLVGMGKMTYEELNKIQDAQQNAYNYLISSSLEINCRFLRRQIKETLDLDEFLKLKLEAVNQFFTANLPIHKEIMSHRKHRGIKVGAKFLLPEHYQSYVNRSELDVYNLVTSSYRVNMGGHLVTFPTSEQLQYAKMEVEIGWYRILMAYKAQMRYEKMVSVKDFKELIETYGRMESLVEEYTQGLKFAPDRALFIQTRINNYESVLPIFRSSIGIRDNQNSEIKVQTGEYKRIGYAWVNNGYNAKPKDLIVSTRNNATLCPTVQTEDRYQIYNQVLSNLAEGGAIAFHLAYLREQLGNTNDSNRFSRRPDPFWQGSDEQRLRLFHALAAESFLDSSNADYFLMNNVVQWKQDGRALFYMLNELKRKPYKMLLTSENLGPLVQHNFLNKKGQPFKYVRQNMSGMINTNKAEKPRLALAIDMVLQSIFPK